MKTNTNPDTNPNPTEPTTCTVHVVALDIKDPTLAGFPFSIEVQVKPNMYFPSWVDREAAARKAYTGDASKVLFTYWYARTAAWNFVKDCDKMYEEQMRRNNPTN
jgi:hypothetical protein